MYWRRGSCSCNYRNDLIIMNKIGIIGSGTMGSGIAHTCALSGFNVLLMDLNTNLLEKSMKIIDKNLNRQLQKNIITQSELQHALQMIQTTTEYDSLIDCYIIIEAAIEDQLIKEKIFTTLDSCCNKRTILATNTSSISITALANKTNRPDKVIGMHFMNPVPIMKLVEIVRGKNTSDITTKKIIECARQMNKKPIECNDSPGFVTNRILMPMINEAIFCLMEGVGEKEAIDEIMHLGMGHPMGPLKLADLIGLDICSDILKVLHQDLKDDKYAPCPLLDQMVAKGHLGRKSNQGFYKY